MEDESLEADYTELLEFLYMCPDGIMRLTTDGTVDIINPHAAQLLMAVTKAGAVDNLFDALAPVAPELRNIVGAFTGASGIICSGHRIFLSRRIPGPRILSCTLLKISEATLMAVLSDVTVQVEQEARLRQTESWFSAMLTSVNDFALFNLDSDGRISHWHASGVRHTGYAAPDVIGQTMHLFYDPEENRQGRAAEQVDCALREGWHLDEGWCLRKDGSRFWCQILVAAQENQNLPDQAFSVVFRDSTQRRVTTDELRRMITTDHLTGAANRGYFADLADKEVKRWRRFGHPTSLIILDVDHFKKINDTFGHRAGDVVLKEIVARCRNILRRGQTIARFGGEEFALLLPDTSLDDTAKIAERLREAVAATPVVTDHHMVSVTISLGCATLDQIAPDVDTVLDVADKALYRAKRSGRNRVELAESEKARDQADQVIAIA